MCATGEMVTLVKLYALIRAAATDVAMAINTVRWSTFVNSFINFHAGDRQRRVYIPNAVLLGVDLIIHTAARHWGCSGRAFLSSSTRSNFFEYSSVSKLSEVVKSKETESAYNLSLIHI